MNLPPTTKPKIHKHFILVGTLILLGLLAWYVKTHASLETLVQEEDRLRANIALWPWKYFFIGFGIYTMLSFIPGTPGKAVVFGWLFGFWQALIIVTVGLTFAAMVIFSLSRYLFRDHVEHRYPKFLATMNKHIDKDEAFYLVTLRLMHFPYSILNPVSGASRISSGTFFWTTLVGLAPSNVIWSYVGVRLPSLRELASGGAESLIDPPLLAALVASATLPFLFRWLAGRFGISSTEARDDTVDPLTR